MSDELNPEIRISVIADTQRGQQSIAAIQQLVAGARAEVEKFAQSGGLGQIAPSSGVIDAARLRIDELETTLVTTERQMQLLDQAIATVGEDSPALDGLISRFDKLQETAQGAVQELVKMPDALEVNAKASVPGLGQSVGGFERPLAQIAGTAGFLGVNQNSLPLQALRGASEITGTIEALSRFREGLDAVKLSADPSALAVGALGVAMVAISFVAKESTKGLGEYIAAQKRAEERQRELRAQLDQISSSEDIDKLRQANDERRQQIEAEIAALKKQRDESTNARIQAVADSDLVRAATFDVFGTTGKALDALGVNTDNADARIGELNAELKTLDASSAELNSTLAQVAVQANEVQQAYFRNLDLEKQRQVLLETATPAELLAGREQTQSTLNTLQNSLGPLEDQILNTFSNALLGSNKLITDEALQQFNDAMAQSTLVDKLTELRQVATDYGVTIPASVQNLVDSYNSQIETQELLKGQLANYTDAEVVAAAATRAGIQGLQDRRQKEGEAEKGFTDVTKAYIAALEEAAAAETKHAQALLDDAAKTSQSITQLEKSRADQLAKQQQADAEAAVIAGFRSQIEAAQAAEAEQARADKITALRQDEQAKEIQALQKHEADKAKAQAAFDLQQKRRQEDLARDENDAAADRDVKAFLRIKERGETELNRAKEDNDLRQKEQDTALTEQIRQIRQDANERIRVERESGQRRITQVQRLEQQLADYQTSLARQRQQQERQIQAQSYQEQITAWRTHLNQVSQELLTGLVNPLRGALGLVGGGVATAPLPVGANVGAGALRGGAGVSVALTIQQQNNGRFASAEDLVRVENNNRTMLQAVAQTVETAVRRARANTGGR